MRYVAIFVVAILLLPSSLSLKKEERIGWLKEGFPEIKINKGRIGVEITRTVSIYDFLIISPDEWLMK